MYKILVVICIFFQIYIFAGTSITYSENPNLLLDWGKDDSRKEVPYDLVYEKNDKIYKGYISDQKKQKSKWISKIEIEDARKISESINRNIENIKNIPYVFISSNEAPFFKIIRGFIYNCNRKGCSALKFKDELHMKIGNTNFKFNIDDFSGYIFSAPSFNNYNIPYYAYPMLRNYSIDKNVEWIDQRVNPLRDMDSMMYASEATYNFAKISKEDDIFTKSTKKEIANYRSENYYYFRFNHLRAMEFKKIKIKRFGKEVIEYASRKYLNNILRKYQEAAFAIAFDKKGAQDIANYMCRHGFKFRMAKENNWDWKIVNNHPQSDNQLYKCKKPLKYYMQDDELWKKFMQYYK
jgi:hypothetical protein